MMGFGEGGEKGPFLKRAFSPPQVTPFIGNSALNFENRSIQELDQGGVDAPDIVGN